MSTWQRILVRHGLFQFGRTLFRLFTNIYIWRQTEDIQLICLYNLLFLLGHSIAFYYGGRLSKNGHTQTVMRAGILGVGLASLTMLVLEEAAVGYWLPISLLFGLSNGQYWVTTHLETYDQIGKKDRASFYGYRSSVTNSINVVSPAFAWVMFTLFASVDTAYTAIFGVSCLSLIAAAIIAKVEYQPHAGEWQMSETWQSLQKVRGFKNLAITNVINMSLFKGALINILLPILIFELLDGEEGVSFVETIAQVFAVISGVAFARYKKSTDYINRLIFLTGSLTTLGVLAMFIELSSLTYTIFLGSVILASASGSIANATVSTNFVHLIPDYKKHRMEYIVILEYFRAIGFSSGYVFVCLANGISAAALRPLLLAMALGAIVWVPLSLRLWHIVHAED